MERLALEEDIESHSWTSRSNEHLQEFPVLEPQVHHFPLKRGNISALLVDWKAWGKNSKDSELMLLLNRDETFNLSRCFPQHVSVGTCPLHTEIAGRERALAGVIPVYLLFQPQSLPQGEGATAVWSVLSSWRWCCFFRLLRYQKKNKGHKEVCLWFEKKIFSLQHFFCIYKGVIVRRVFLSTEENGSQLDFSHCASLS